MSLIDVPTDDLLSAVESRPPVLSGDGLLLYGIGGVVLLIAIANAVVWYRNRRRTDPDLKMLLDEETLTAAELEHDLLDDITARQQDVVAPAAVEWGTRTARVGEQWTTTLYIADYPDAPKDGCLSGLFELTDVEFDLTARLVPKNHGRARDELQRVADNLQADADLERSVRGAYLQERANKAAATYKAVENGQQVFEQELVVDGSGRHQRRPPAGHQAGACDAPGTASRS